MNEQQSNMDPHFMQLVLSLQAAAMQQMGKVASMISGEIERDLAMARQSIDLLGMLKTKTEGNLTDEEEKILSHVLYELRLNFVDESKKAPTAEQTDTDEDKTNGDGDSDQTPVDPEEGATEKSSDSASD